MSVILLDTLRSSSTAISLLIVLFQLFNLQILNHPYITKKNGCYTWYAFFVYTTNGLSLLNLEISYLCISEF